MKRQLFLVLCLTVALAAPAFAQLAPVPEFSDKKRVTQGEQKKEKKKWKKKKWKKGPRKFQVNATLHTLWKLEDAPEMPGNDFSIDLARVKFTWRPYKELESVLKVDVDQLDEPQETHAVLRDAYVKLKPWRFFGVQVGQFKKPFSRWHLRGKSRLETIFRGIGNQFIVEDLGFGDRDVGLQFVGKLGKKVPLQYFVGVFNGAGLNEPEEDLNGVKDIVARLKVDPMKNLSIGASGSLKMFDSSTVEHATKATWAAGLDARLYAGGFRLLVEGLMGENYDRCSYSDNPYTCYFVAREACDAPKTWSAMVVASYKHRLNKGRLGLSIEPVLRGEVMTPDADLANGQVYSVAPGVNLHIGRHVRLMLNGEFVIPGSDAPDAWPEAKRLLMQLALHM